MTQTCRSLSMFLIVAAALTRPVAAADPVAEAVAESINLEKQTKYDEAVLALTNVRKPAYLVYVRLGWLHYLRADYEKSKQFYQQAMRMQSKALEPRLGYMLPLLAQYRYAEVEATAKSVLTIDANHPTASLRLAYALRMQSKFNPARDVNARMLELYPTDLGFLVEQLLSSVGAKHPDVPLLCETILALDPDNVTAKYYKPSTVSMTRR